MADLFISYSRTDKPFVQRLHAALAGRQRDVWVDWEDIPPAARWLDDIMGAIEAAQAFVFVISPEAAASAICAREVAHAALHKKRIVPLLRREVPPAALPAEIAARNWIYLRDGDNFDAGSASLLTAIDTDLDWVRAHTRLLTRALEWDRGAADEAFLLRGADLRAALAWLGGASEAAQRQPTELQHRYIAASQAAEARELERLRELYDRALSRQLAAQAELVRRQRGNLLERSVLLAGEALARSAGPESDAALRTGLALLPRRLAAIEHGDQQLTQVGFTPDGRWLVSAARDGTLAVVDPIDGGERHRLVQGAPVIALALSTDSRLALAGDTDGVAVLWELASGRRLRRFAPAGGGALAALAFDADTSRFACGDRAGNVLVRRVSGGRRLVHLPHPDVVGALAFAGDRLASACHDGAARLWDLASGQLVAEVRHQPAEVPMGRRVVSALAVAPASGLVASGGSDGRVFVFDAERGELRQAFDHGGSVHAAAFDPSGSRLASAGQDGVVQVWDLQRARSEWRLVHESIAWHVAFSADGARLATASDDRTARLWSAADGRELLRAVHREGIFKAALAPDGERLATAGADGQAGLWTTHSGAGIELSLPAGARCFGFVAANAIVTGSSDGEVVRWDVASGRRVATAAPADSFDNADTAMALRPDANPIVSQIALSPDGGQLAVADHDGTLRLLDAATLRETRRVSVGAGVVIDRIAWSADGRRLAAACWDGTARVFDAATLRALGQLDHGHSDVHAVAFLPDGRHVVSGGGPDAAWLWDAETGERHARFGHAAKLRALAVSPDGRWLATAGEDAVLGLHELGSGRTIARLQHDGSVVDVIFDPSGRRIATASLDQSARLVDAVDGRELARLAHDDIVWSLAFDSTGSVLATASWDRTARLWDVASGRERVRIVHPEPVMAVGFGPGDRHLAVVAGASVPLWLWRPADLIDDAGTRLRRPLTAEEWRLYLPDEPYAPRLAAAAALA